MTRRTRRLLAVAALSVLAMALSACTASGDTKVDRPHTGVADLGSVSIADVSVEARLDTATGSVALPLDAISLSSPDIQDASDHAVAVLTDRCMTARGFPAASQSVDWRRVEGDDRLFGQWDVATASAYGFGLNPAYRAPSVDEVSRGAAYGKNYAECQKKVVAGDRLHDDLVFLQTPGQIDYAIYTNSYDRTVASATAKKAFADRADCMEKAGIVVDPKTHGASDQYLHVSAEQQVHAATVEATCSVQTGAVQTLYTTMARYEQAYLDQNEAQVAALEKKRRAVKADFERVIVGGSD